MNMRMNLTGLADLANAQLANKGQPLFLALGDILPDPDNPRNADDDTSAAAVEAQEELDADVAARGVKTPISVRPHPTIPGKYIINYGHRRYKSACRNELAAIPAFVDEKFDSYDQVNENELRIGLTTRARALFIKGRLDAGDSKGEIAERMRKKNQTFITEHLALIDAPDCVNRTYAAGVTSARTLYDLRQAWQEFPVEIEAWCRQVPHISRDGIREALEGFRHDEAGAAGGDVTESTTLQQGGFRHDEKAASVTVGSVPAKLMESRQDENEEANRTGKDDVGIRGGAGGEGSSEVARSKSVSASAGQARVTGGIVVRYKGKLARIAVDVVVPIVMDGGGEVLNVPLAGLVFER